MTEAQDAYEAWKEMMGFRPHPISQSPPPDETARKAPAPPDGPMPVEDPQAGSAWASGSPAPDERSLVLDCLYGITLALMDLIERCGEDRRGCEALIRLLWTVKQREFDLREGQEKASN